MNRLIFTFILCCIVLLSKGQTLHLMLVSDTDDPTIGVGCKRNVQRLERKMDEIMTAIKMPVVKYKLEADAVSQKNIMALVDSVKTKKDDVILFHYSGHGVNEGNGGKWPRLLVSGKQIHLVDIHRKLKAKKARLTLTLGDCCNLTSSSMVSVRKVKHVIRKKLDKRSVKHYTHLFFKEKGDILASASQAGQAAYYDANLGGYFTLSFCLALYLEAQNETLISWEKVMEKTGTLTKETASGWLLGQNPQFSANTYQYIQLHNLVDFNDKIIQYTIKNGDTLWGIAEKYKVSIKKIKHWNQLRNHVIQIGDVLTIYKY